MNNSLLIVGCGDLGSRLGIKMVDLGWSVFGIRRNINQIPQPIKGIHADLYKNEIPDNWPKNHFDYIVFCVAPNRQEHDQYNELYYKGLQNTLTWLQQSQQKPKKIFIVSSTAVYAQNNGEWLNEESLTDPTSPQGKIMLAMEQLALTSTFSTTCLRLSGIYGPHRTSLINQAKQGINYPDSPPLYANRIHVEDAANLLQQLIQHHFTGKPLSNYYIGVDNQPAPIQETLAWMREKLNVTELKKEYGQRRTGSKRLSNQLAKSIGWVPNYPNYQTGYNELLKDFI